MGKLTGASAAKDAARAQAKALEEQTRSAQASAAETARQASIQTAQAQSREVAITAAESMQQADALASAAPEVETGAAGANVSTTRKRARFQTPSSLTSVSI